MDPSQVECKCRPLLFPVGFEVRESGGCDSACVVGLPRGHSRRRECNEGTPVGLARVELERRRVFKTWM